MEDEVLAAGQRGDLLDAEVAAHREVHDRRQHLARFGLFVRERARLRGHERGRRLVFGLHGAARRGVAPVSPPREPARDDGEQREAERPVVADEPERLPYGRRPADLAGGPADHHGEALAWPEPAHRAEAPEALDAVERVVLPAAAARAAVRDRAHGAVGDARGHLDEHLREADRDLPLVARRVPVELVVVLEGQDAAADAVDDRDRLLRVGGARHPGLDLHVAARIGDLVAERRPALGVDPDALQPEGELIAAAIVANGDRAEDALVRALEVEGDVLADDEARVGVDLEAHDEAVDGEAARLRRGRYDRDREQHERSHARPQPATRG